MNITQIISEAIGTTPYSGRLHIEEHPFDLDKFLKFHEDAAHPDAFHYIPDVPMKQGTIKKHYGLNTDGFDMGELSYDKVHYNTLPVDHESIPKHVSTMIARDMQQQGDIVQHVHIYDHLMGGHTLVQYHKPSNIHGSVRTYWHDNMKPDAKET